MVFSILSTFHIKSQMVLSPSGYVSVKVDLSNEGVPRYSISYKNKSVIQPSSLGFVLKDGNNFNNGFEITNAETSSVDEFWNPVWGESKNNTQSLQRTQNFSQTNNNSAFAYISLSGFR